MEARAEPIPAPPVAEAADTALPPRPDLGRYMMGFGFMLQPTRFFDACWQRCGDYFTLLPEADRVLVVTADPEAVKQVFTGDPNLLYAGEGNVTLAPILGPGSTLLLDGPEHLRHRRLLLPPFHGERMRNYGPMMAEVAERHLAAWPRSGRLATLPTMQAITLEVIMRAVFGVGDERRRAEISRPLRALLDMLASRRRVLMLALTVGRTGPRSPWARFLSLRREADALLYEEIRSRRADPHGDEGDDILSLLLAARDEDGRPLSDSELRDELMTLLVAGHETTATALAWALERLTRTPAVLDRLLAERRAGSRRVPGRRDQGDPAPAPGGPGRRPPASGADASSAPGRCPRASTSRPRSTSCTAARTSIPEPLAFRPERFLDRPAGHLRVDPVRGRRAALPGRQLRDVRDEGRAGRGPRDRRACARPRRARASR